MRPLAILGDNITTDHLSPFQMRFSRFERGAGEYLTKMEVPEEDFNSLRDPIEDHLTAQRATFANPKLFNEMVKDAGEVVQGSLKRLNPKVKLRECVGRDRNLHMNRKQP
ncbi:hypothetical protein O9993_05750 [Vibrio lentus]|nr:hypothetical protein [Vibrio lentus]